jgi:hypothetical protein
MAAALLLGCSPTRPRPRRRAVRSASASSTRRGRQAIRFHAKNVVAVEKLRTELKGKVELIQFPVTVLRDLRKLATEVNHGQSEKSPMTRKVNASFMKLRAQRSRRSSAPGTRWPRACTTSSPGVSGRQTTNRRAFRGPG